MNNFCLVGILCALIIVFIHLQDIILNSVMSVLTAMAVVLCITFGLLVGGGIPILNTVVIFGLPAVSTIIIIYRIAEKFRGRKHSRISRF